MTTAGGRAVSQIVQGSLRRELLLEPTVYVGMLGLLQKLFDRLREILEPLGALLVLENPVSCPAQVIRSDVHEQLVPVFSPRHYG